jgi:hypothetical protein
MRFKLQASSFSYFTNFPMEVVLYCSHLYDPGDALNVLGLYDTLFPIGFPSKFAAQFECNPLFASS